MKAIWLSVLALVAGTAGAQTKFAYEAAAIKPFNSVENRMSFRVDAGIFEASGVRLEDLVRFAYGKNSFGATGEDVIGMPAELKDKRWDVRAKADEETVEALKKLKPEDQRKASRDMMMALLDDRFHLKSHLETKDAPVLFLVVAKGGPKLKEVAKDADAPDGRKDANGDPARGSISVRNGVMEATDVPITALVSLLEGQMQRKVEDHTGLKGAYDITLRWRPESGGGKAAGDDENLPALETAIQEQLGVKLENGRGDVERVVIDHAELPSEN